MMTDSPLEDLKFDDPAVYRIRVCGRVPASWSDRLEGMAISVRAARGVPPVTALEGELADQASLLGVLDALYALRLIVLSVQRLHDGPLHPAR